MILISDKIILKSRKDVVLTHLYIKSKQFGIDISEGIRELLYYVYELGSITSEKDFNELTNLCIANTPIKTKDSVRNTISKCVRLKILNNVGKYQKELSIDWLPNNIDDIIGLEYKIINQDYAN